jgi:hypothetical protein
MSDGRTAGRECVDETIPWCVGFDELVLDDGERLPVMDVLLDSEIADAQDRLARLLALKARRDAVRAAR